MKTNQTHIYARDLSENDIELLRKIVKNAPKKIPYECFWGTKRFLCEELERFLWYYDNRPESRNIMACEYIEMGDNWLTK